MPRPEALVLGRSPAMVQALTLCARFAAGTHPILLLGQPGTGKTELARYIHRQSGRSGTFMEDSGAAQPDGMELAALMGHRKGAYTDAVDDQAGLIEAAHEGTFFIDELDAASPRVQAFLLKVLETRTVRRLGEVRSRQVDVRFLAATNADLPALIAAGRFRQDLFDRFGYFVIDVPALTQRLDEIPLLVELFLGEETRQLGDIPPPQLAPEVLDALLTAPWNGNVRELRFLCGYLAVVCQGKTWIELADLPSRFIATLKDLPPTTSTVDPVQRAVEAAGGNREAAARALGISPRHLYRLLSRTKPAVSKSSA